MVAVPPRAMDDIADRPLRPEELELALCEALPGLQLLDRDLEGEDLRVDWLGVDADGRAVLVLRMGDDADACVLGVLDLLGESTSLARLLARHLEHPALDPALAPELVVLLEREEPRLVRRLAPLTGERLHVLVRRELRSGRGSTTFLVPADGEGVDGLGTDPGLGVERFLEALDARERAAAEDLLDRLARLDEDLRCVAVPGGLAWRLRGAGLARWGRRGGRLEGSVPERDGPWQLEDVDGAEAFLDAAVRRYLDLVEGRSGDDPALAQVELRPAPPAGHLSAAERDAFRA